MSAARRPTGRRACPPCACRPDGIAFDAAAVNSMVRERDLARRSAERTRAHAGLAARQAHAAVPHAASGLGPEGSDGPARASTSLRDESGFFGSTAPLQEMLAKKGESRGADPYRDLLGCTRAADGAGPAARASHCLGRCTSSWSARSRRSSPAPGRRWRIPPATSASSGWRRRRRRPRSDYAMNGKATGLGFANPDGSKLAMPDPALDVFTFRTARLHVVSEPLSLAGTPIRGRCRRRRRQARSRLALSGYRARPGGVDLGRAQ